MARVNVVTDVHMHIIPGIDDGSGSMEESLEEIRMALAQGVGAIFATPHSWAIKNCHSKMLGRFHALQREVQKNRIPVKLYLGCEILCYPHSVEGCIQRVREGTFPGMGGTRYVLVEFDPDDFSDEDALYCIDRFTAAGYIPIIAHAERYGFSNVPTVREMKAHGAKIQINAYSVVNESKESIRSLANTLLREQLVDLVGTDTHRLDHRPPVLKEGVAAIREKYPADYADRILTGNAEEWLMGTDTHIYGNHILMLQ